ncbi:E3 ubiquitin-protein ligase TRIM56-like isoform X2 [Haliotis rubra]|uniref:E3 ubiquitin-protein ligase TRIM56-like isoform X2 n=1 Tax=Haliotis rubra TaxID=36100 RepID=UPI001EE5CA3C|nr:E3 ubiquitin-protein ligase TRIM56-like isoform X2 [Haliotis rubra]
MWFLSSRMDDFPKCSVCQQQFTFKGHAPYLLPCLHAVCETCVTSGAGGVISCSTCQREVNLTNSSLQKDAVRQKEIFHLTVKHRPTELLCTHEDDGNQAVCWCQDCEELLCEYCQNIHSNFKVTRRHVVQNFADLELTFSTVPKFCSIHKYHPLYLFDKSCKKLICARCRIEDHVDHEVEKVDVAADSVTKQLEYHKNELSTLQTRHQANMHSIRQGTESTDETHNSLKENIRHTFHSLRSQLNQREKELLIDLENHTKETKAAQHALLTACEEDKKTCKRVLDYINNVFLFASKSDILGLERYVGEMTRTCLDTAAPQTYAVPRAVFNTNSLSKLKANVSGFGAILTMDMDGKSEIIADRGTQTDDDFMADVEMKHKMRIDEKDAIEKKDAKTIDLLLGVARECGVHLLKPGAVDGSLILKCIPLKYDKDSVNLNKVHINTEGDLVNRKSDTRPAEEETEEVHRHMQHCASPNDGCPQYWEVENRVNLDKQLSENCLILSVGVCREEQRDLHHRIDERPYSYCMNVAHLTKHIGLCNNIWKEGKRVLCLPDTLPNTAGASNTLHYGVVYDDARKKIVFIDLKEKKVISTLDNVDCSEPLWPMFGVYNPHLLTVSMGLVVGSDINMTEEKKAMIVKALS